ncbi:MAG: transcription-repair coupling factor [Spirochaetes bacterium GWF1_31_7]|nr:MAG: transcription-repair coupling factor [Spirochaetes bacterium GWE1_32_154]OHD46528.1 MAG: transcription-repair coupling factor [Spirochaetes bacterium GWF1_31_7]OHD49337.1 MAG: transcription-repair coupling factor [Spirochaetes bacterium GWE2_31_10]HBD93543.1 transcription-repair coupling factor [Spirochaetia bacterium]HBI36807.1 transcription-repair coupling factor [Spirochaetia bacterium]
MRFKNWVNEKINTESLDNLYKSIDSNKTIRLSGCSGSFLSLLSDNLIKKYSNSIFFICKDNDELEAVYNDLEALETESLYRFPSLGLTPYQLSVVNEEIVSMRLDVVNGLINSKKMLIITTIDALVLTFTPKAVLKKYFLKISIGLKYPIEQLFSFLIESGYSRVKQVTYPGEFAVRGEIVDIYFSTLRNPVRLEFFDDEIEIIKSFNPETQKSCDRLDCVEIPPFKEILYGKDELSHALSVLKTIGGDEENVHHIEHKISQFNTFDGEHFFLPLFYEKTSILDFVNDSVIIVNDRDMIEKRCDSICIEFSQNFNASYNKYRPKFHPDALLFSLQDLYSKSFKIIEANYFNKAGETFNVLFDCKGVNAYAGSLDLFKEDIRRYLENKFRIVIFAVTEAQAGRLTVLFDEFNPVNDMNDFRPEGVSIIPSVLSSGFISESMKIMFLNDYEIFGKRNKLSKHFYTRRTESIESFIDLKPGDYVVHIHHGIGKFIGIERVKSKEVEKDYIAILYADDDKVFIPIEQMNFVQKYSSGDLEKPKLDKIGSKGWARAKEKVKESVNKLAAELVKLYSFRLNQRGISFLPDTPWQKEFEAKFPYDETEDQLLTIEEVKRDMESNRPMDRLICGDVGFGKTEVAIRAAFKAVMSGRQVAILVPTTILTEQHFENISLRLSDYPVKVEMLSRFRTPAEQKKIIKLLADGEVDIIVGTHRLISDDVVYKNLGLLIIDEEHRFGVKHKEKIKQVKKNLDCLSMTATPIPRTLHMSLAKIRDMSIINTPPRERLPVETFVMEFNQDILKMGIEHELAREGQVFFLYNRVKTINEMKKYIETVVPQARIVVAHGQMEGDELEDIIHDFINYKYDILLTTTIIESGIDIPRVNTIFIDRAHMFGLAQLYQLRGRVGRSNIKAYAYLFYDDNVAVSEDAMKKLRVISEYTELGSGFKVAMKDMEIRGAGNMLGPEQHGDILAVGFSLYCKLLTDAVKELKKTSDTPEMFDELVDEDDDIFLDIKYNGFIPDSYISDPKEKIEIYKRISGITHEEDLDRIKSLLLDRFGPIPEDVKRLLYIGEIRIICRKMGVNEIIEKSNCIEIKFNSSDKINFGKLMIMVTQSKGRVYLQGSKSSSIFIKIGEYDEFTIEDKGRIIKETLEGL